MSSYRRILVLACVLQPVIVALAAAPVIVGQSHRAFTVRELRINRGEVVRFSNSDEFLHHIYVRSPSFNFNSGEQEPGQNVDVAFPVAGTFDVRCEIHPRMLVTVTVN